MTATPEKLIPLMPCPDIKIQVAFYQCLGFAVSGTYTSPNPYAVLTWKTIELHFWGSKKAVAAQNATMCYLSVPDVEEVHQTFTLALKAFYGKIPRTGFPKITKVRSLVDDRRFTLTDPGGNTLYIGTKTDAAGRFFRTLSDTQHAKLFAVWYDVLYSKEDPALANSMQPTYARMGDKLTGLDKAKFLLLLADIQKHLALPVDDEALQGLIKEFGEGSEEWRRIRQKYVEIISEE